MTDEPSDIDFHAYVDDQLDTGRRFAVEDHLSRHPTLAARVMGDLSTRTALQLLSRDTGPAHPDLAGRAKALRARPTSTFWRLAAPLGGLSLVAAAGCAVLLLRAAPPDYVDYAITSHRVAMMRATMASQIEAPAYNPGEIFSRTRIDIPSLPEDWRVTDVQLFPTGTGNALLVAVRTADGQPLTIFAMRQRTGAPERPDTVREGAQSVAYWRRGEMFYALTGEAEPQAIDETAEALNRNWS